MPPEKQNSPEITESGLPSVYDSLFTLEKSIVQGWSREAEVLAESSSEPAPGSSDRGSEYQRAYIALFKLKKAFIKLSDEDDDSKEEDESVSGLGPEGPERLQSQPLASSNMTYEDLTKLNITCSDVLVLYPNWENRISETTSLGQDELWSSTNLYRHLALLGSVDRRSPTNSASAHAWIDAIFFRASAMVSQNQHLVLGMMKQIVPGSVPAFSSILPKNFNLPALAEFVDYAAMVVPQDIIRGFVQSSPMIDMPPSFFVVKDNRDVRRSLDLCLSTYIPQGVYQMFKCGKAVQKKILRGAITNGHDWIFLLIKINDNDEGASFMQSPILSLRFSMSFHGEVAFYKPWPDLIAAILLQWIENSSDDLGSDEWFHIYKEPVIPPVTLKMLSECLNVVK